MVLLARFQEDTALGDGSFLADEVSHIIKGDGYALAVHAFDFDRLRFYDRLHRFALLDLSSEGAALNCGSGIRRSSASA